MRSAADDSALREGPSTFPLTSWATVLEARDAGEKREHLDRLFRKYWRPIFLHIRRWWRVGNEEEARDLTQGFFLRLLETDFLKDVSPEKGRFRAYLKACLRHYLADVRKSERALKRGGAATITSLDAADAPSEIPSTGLYDAFDLEWTVAVLEAAVSSLEDTLRSMDRELAFRLFRAIDLEPEYEGRPNYSRFAELFEISVRRVKSELEYARRVLRRLVYAHVREYTASDPEAEAEFRELFPRG